MALTDDVATVLVGTVGLNGESADAARMTAIEADLDTMLARPAIDALGDVPDVDTATTPPVAGDTLVYDDADSTWKPGTTNAGLTVFSGDPPTVTNTDQTQLQFYDGLEMFQHSGFDYRSVVRPTYGGTGVQPLVARSDHYHTTPSTTRRPYAASGYLSSGSRTLDSTTVVLASGVTYEVTAEVKGQVRGADAGPAYYLASVTIGGVTVTSGAGDYWTVQGVPTPLSWEQTRTITGSGGAVAVSASIAFSSGAGFNVDAGRLIIKLRPNH